MNIPTSEYYSSGCESGWTVYFDQLSNSADHQYNHDFVTKSCDDDSNEDLSMVSDASSGPQHYSNVQYGHNDQINNYCAATGGVVATGDGSGGGGSGVYSQYYGYHVPSPLTEETKKKSSKNTNSSKKKQYNVCLDDTASSPDFDFDFDFDFSQDNVPPSDFSQVCSTEQFEGEYSMTKKKFGFFKSSTKGKSSSFLGRRQ